MKLRRHAPNPFMTTLIAFALWGCSAVDVAPPEIGGEHADVFTDQDVEVPSDQDVEVPSDQDVEVHELGDGEPTEVIDTDSALAAETDQADIDITDGGPAPLECDADSQLTSCDETTCVSVTSLGNGECDSELNCAALDFDGGDCCETGQIKGCDGVCVPEGVYADGVCDEAFNCEQAGFDGGDCVVSCGAGLVIDCLGGCSDETELGNGQCDAVFNCEGFELDQGDCCPSGQDKDCFGACKPSGLLSVLVGDGVCSEEVNCPFWNNDGGDCDPECPDGQQIACIEGECININWLGDGICDNAYNCDAYGLDGGDCVPCECPDTGNPCTALECDAANNGYCAMVVDATAEGCTGCVASGQGTMVTLSDTIPNANPALAHDIAVRPNGRYAVISIVEQVGSNAHVFSANCYDTSGQSLGSGSFPATGLNAPDGSQGVTAAASQYIGPEAPAYAMVGVTQGKEVTVAFLTEDCQTPASVSGQLLGSNVFGTPAAAFDDQDLLVAYNEAFKPTNNASYTTCESNLVVLDILNGDVTPPTGLANWIPKEGIAGPTSCAMAGPDVDVRGDVMAASVVSPQSGSCAAGAIVFKRSGATPSGWVKDFTDSDVSVADHETGTVRVAVLSDSRVVALSSGCDKELSARVYGANPSFELESESQDLVIEFGTQSTVPYGYFDIVAGTAKTAYISFFSFSPNPIQGSWPVTKQSAHLRMSVNTGFGSNPTFDLVEEQSGYTSNAPHKVGTRLRLGGSSCGSHVRAVGGPLFTTGLQFGLLPPPLDISTTWAVQNFAVDDSGDGEPDYCCE